VSTVERRGPKRLAVYVGGVAVAALVAGLIVSWIVSTVLHLILKGVLIAVLVLAAAFVIRILFSRGS
jgi:hypothetical protein